MGGCDNVLDGQNTGPMELVAVVTHALFWSTGGCGGGGCDNVLDEYNTEPTELVAVVNMLHMLSDGQQGRWWGVGGCDNVLDEYGTGP